MIGSFLLLEISSEVIVFRGLKRAYSRAFTQMEELFRGNTHYDAVFFGSSRTLYGIDPCTIRTAAGLNVFNAGLEGANIREIRLALNAFLQVHPDPTTIYVMIDPHGLMHTEKEPFNVVLFSLFLQNRSLYKDLREQLGNKVLLWKYLPFTRLTQLSDYLRSRALRGLFERESFKNCNGFVELHQPFRSAVEFAAGPDTLLDSDGMAILKSIADTVSKHRSHLVLLSGSFEDDFYKKHNLQGFYDQVAETFQNNTEFIHAINFSDTSLYKDETHLNAKGARLFSEILSGRIYKCTVIKK